MTTAPKTSRSHPVPPVPAWIAAGIGPRRVGGRYRHQGEDYTVLDVQTARTDWMGWSVTEATDAELAAGTSRTHCTGWDDEYEQVLVQPAAGPGEDDAAVELSLDGRYRYALTRDWDSTRPRVTFIMLNPSTATATVTDSTIRRCRAYAHSWGGGGLLVLNLFALRSTDPRQLYTHLRPVGPDNDTVLAARLRESRTDRRRVIVAWGTHGGLHGRDQQVLTLLREQGIVPHCLRITDQGHPHHPLRLPAVLTPVPFGGPR